MDRSAPRTAAPGPQRPALLPPRHVPAGRRSVPPHPQKPTESSCRSPIACSATCGPWVANSALERLCRAWDRKVGANIACQPQTSYPGVRPQMTTAPSRHIQGPAAQWQRDASYERRGAGKMPALPGTRLLPPPPGTAVVVRWCREAGSPHPRRLPSPHGGEGPGVRPPVSHVLDSTR
jgi:hypothetical protein